MSTEPDDDSDPMVELDLYAVPDGWTAEDDAERQQLVNLWVRPEDTLLTRFVRFGEA